MTIMIADDQCAMRYCEIMAMKVHNKGGIVSASTILALKVSCLSGLVTAAVQAVLRASYT